MTKNRVTIRFLGEQIPIGPADYKSDWMRRRFMYQASIGYLWNDKKDVLEAVTLDQAKLILKEIGWPDPELAEEVDEDCNPPDGIFLLRVPLEVDNVLARDGYYEFRKVIGLFEVVIEIEMP